MVPEPELLATGIEFGESPRWPEGRPWFSDWGAEPGPDNETVLFPTAREWHSSRNTSGGAGTGQVLTVPAPAPGVGWASPGRFETRPSAAEGSLR
jgi:hypothetical protein